MTPLEAEFLAATLKNTDCLREAANFICTAVNDAIHAGHLEWADMLLARIAAEEIRGPVLVALAMITAGAPVHNRFNLIRRAMELNPDADPNVVAALKRMLSTSVPFPVEELDYHLEPDEIGF